MFDAGNLMVNFNGFIVWILVYTMTIWQCIVIITLPMHCMGNNQISLSKSPSAWGHTCVMWYGEPTCWGFGIRAFSVSILIHILALRTLKRYHSQR